MHFKCIAIAYHFLLVICSTELGLSCVRLTSKEKQPPRSRRRHWRQNAAWSDYDTTCILARQIRENEIRALCTSSDVEEAMKSLGIDGFIVIDFFMIVFNGIHLEPHGILDNGMQGVLMVF